VNIAAIRLAPGADLKQSLLDYCSERRVDAACIISCVGSLHGALIRLAGAGGGTAISGKLEILSLSGTLSRHGCHLHIALADSAGKVMGGHVLDGCRIHTTAELVLGLVPGAVFKREYDAATGYKELRIEPPDDDA
jgi:predicted DNA-binding protein with PD1-like motif